MDRLQREQFLKILEKNQAGTASEEEVDFLNAYYEVFDIRSNFTSGLNEDKRLLLKGDLKNAIDENISSYQKNRVNAGRKTVYKLSLIHI